MNMFAVGRIGSYISRGVNTVSGPFLPLGGAVDIIVVEQQDGSFKSTPWYIRFGKLQGVWKATERVVNINVNGVDACFHMYLDHKGEAYFVEEIDALEGESESYTSSTDEMEANYDKWRTQKSLSYNYDANRPDLVSELEGGDRKILARSTSSRRRRIFGLPIGRRSAKENGLPDGEAGVEGYSFSSVERAEIAAELLEVRWTTNHHTSKYQKARVFDENKGDSSVSSEDNVASGTSHCLQPVSGHVETDAQVSCLTIPDNSMEFILEGTYIEADLTSVKPDISDGVHNSCVNKDQISTSEFSEIFESSSELSQILVNEDINCSASSEASCDNMNDLQDNIGKCNGGDVTLFNISATHLTYEVGTSSQCIIGEVPLEDSPAVEPGKRVTGSINELCINDLSAGTSNLNSPPVVLEKESSIANVTSSPLSSSAMYCVEHPTQGINNKINPFDDKEEQFFFSDLDDLKVEKVKHIQTSSSGSSLGSREDEVPDSILDKSYQVTSSSTQDNKIDNHPYLRMSCPISISKVRNDSDEALASVAESLPIMTLDGDNLSLNAPKILSRSLDSTLEALKAVNDEVPLTSGLSGVQQQVAQSHLTTVSSQIPDNIRKIISDPAVEVSLCRHLLFDGMGYEAAALAFNAEKLDIDNFLSHGLNILEDDKLVVRIGGLYFPWDSALPIASAIGSHERLQILEPKGMIAVGEADNQSSEVVSQKSKNSGSESKKRWPFSFKRSGSQQSKNYGFETAAEVPNKTDVIPRCMKKKLRAKFPSSEQLASLNLKEGKNVVTFTFSTENLGEQKVEARIFLWKWNARVVISDVDGTITKSDVLGQFMPLMGIDWSQTGVTHLFSAIKENGYQLLFLSARSISQAYHTRQFLFNLKQDGKALPEGPVLISPDGLFPSLYREVIRRAPHEFKISCLEDVKLLFPPDHNPFYAGFGNRDTDELSYVKVGIPKGKIFTINPKGQVVVNRRVDSKTYTSLHVLVHDMFPPTTLHEQEDYNSWNFWRLPPPDAII